ncbi:MAG: HAMP domain-containing histidine kinase [Lachnospiraceae bacterium]|nr:HAMP domain-containing histidine kinase [Lachnospiraceae bacterium]
MKFFRNPEIKQEIRIWAAATAALILVVYLTANLAEAAGVARGIFDKLISSSGLIIFCILLTMLTGLVLHLVFSYRRYRSIRKLSDEIDHILHGTSDAANASWVISDYEEGELNILKCELNDVLRSLKEQTEAAQKEKQYLADSLADISHQLRTPLTSMELILTLFDEPDLTEERRQELLLEARRLVQRIRWLMEALLKLSKLDAGVVPFALEHMSAQELIRRARMPLEIPLELKQIQVKENIQPDADLLADPGWTTEALENILKNCIEYTPEGGVITVTAVKNPLYTGITVQDNGPGFDLTDIPHLFERFYKGKSSSADSVGIGLALARTILAREDGTVKAGNAPEGGARFEVRLPHA